MLGGGGQEGKRGRGRGSEKERGRGKRERGKGQKRERGGGRMGQESGWLCVGVGVVDVVTDGHARHMASGEGILSDGQQERPARRPLNQLHCSQSVSHGQKCGRMDLV